MAAFCGRRWLRAGVTDKNSVGLHRAMVAQMQADGNVEPATGGQSLPKDL
jgi:hypothetical protein